MKSLHLLVVILCVVVQLNVISGSKGKYHKQALNADRAELSLGRNGLAMKRGVTKRTKKVSATQRPIGWDTSSNNQQRPAAAAPQQPVGWNTNNNQQHQQAAPPAYSPQQPAPPPYSPPAYSPPQNQGPPPSYQQNPMQQPAYQPQPQVVNNFHQAPAQTGSGSSGPGILGTALIGGAAGLGGAALYDYAFKSDSKEEEKPAAAVAPTVVAGAAPVVAVPEAVAPVAAAPAVVAAVVPAPVVEGAPAVPAPVEGAPAVPALVEGVPLALPVPEILSSDKPTINTDPTTVLPVNEVLEQKTVTSNEADKQTIECAGLGTTTKYSLNVLLISVIISIFY